MLIVTFLMMQGSGDNSGFVLMDASGTVISGTANNTNGSGTSVQAEALQQQAPPAFNFGTPPAFSETQQQLLQILGGTAAPPAPGNPGSGYVSTFHYPPVGNGGEPSMPISGHPGAPVETIHLTKADRRTTGVDEQGRSYAEIWAWAELAAQARREGRDPPPSPARGSGSQQAPPTPGVGIPTPAVGTPEQFQFLLRKVSELETALQKKEEEAKKEKTKTFPPEADEHGFRYYLVKDGVSKSGGNKEGAYIGVGVSGAKSGLKQGVVFSPSASGDITGYAQLEESVSGFMEQYDKRKVLTLRL